MGAPKPSQTRATHFSAPVVAFVTESAVRAEMEALLSGDYALHS